MRGGGRVVDKKEQAYNDWRKGKKYKEIAEKHGVSVSAVKSWVSRDFKNRGCDLGHKKVATTKKELQPKPRGAPKGNKNAIGNKGGAPLGSSNALKHGGYSHRKSKKYWDFLDDGEENLLDEISQDTEELLLEQIKLFTIRERYILNIIREEKARKGGLILSSVIRTENKVEFRDEFEKQMYDELVDTKKADDKIGYFGHKYQTQTATENVLKIIKDLESELTRIQRAKTQAITELQKIRDAKNNNDSEAKTEAVDDWVSAVITGGTDE